MILLARQKKRIHRSVKPLEAGRRRRAYRDIFIACLSGRCILFKSLGSMLFRLKKRSYCARFIYNNRRDGRRWQIY